MTTAFKMYIVLIATFGSAWLAGQDVRGGRTKSEASQPTVPADAKPIPVVVELFTSEGCSDCPPADVLLAQLNKTQPVTGVMIITLEQHVDYWDHQGWRDPFSSAKFTERQRLYAAAFHNASVYTPQMVVDGRAEFVGSHERKARQTIAESAKIPKTEISVSIVGDSPGAPEIPLQIHVAKLLGATGGDPAEIFLAITESGLHSDVARGENAGRKLDHLGVVRSLERIGTSEKNVDTGISVAMRAKVPKNWKRENLRAVVFIQEQRSRHILGATEIFLR
jgi:hypothetical protein